MFYVACFCMPWQLSSPRQGMHCKSPNWCTFFCIYAETMRICHVFMFGFLQVQMASRTPAFCDAVVPLPAYGDAIRTAPFSAWDLDAPRNGGGCHTCSSDAHHMFQAEKSQRVAVQQHSSGHGVMATAFARLLNS